MPTQDTNGVVLAKPVSDDVLKNLDEKVDGQLPEHRDALQTSLDGEIVDEKLPQVATTRGHVIPWNRSFIVDMLMRETKLAYKFYGVEPCNRIYAEDLARNVENRVKEMHLKTASGPLVREVVNIELLERGHQEWRNVLTRVGMPVFDANLIDTGNGFESKENSNLTDGPETAHKKKADKIAKEQALLQLPPELARMHMSGDFHIHDLEYFTTRTFCMDWDLRVLFKCGILPDGIGNQVCVAGPAKHATVAILQAAKHLGSAQTNFSGGQGFYNFCTFIAPYLEGMDYDEIKQLSQMFIYEIGQMMVARGSQVVFSSIQMSPGVPKLWRDKPAVYRGLLHDGKEVPLRTYSEFERENRLFFKALVDVMLGGDYWGKPFNFPKPEISIEPEFLVPGEEDVYRGDPEVPTYEELYDMSFQLAAKHGTPYFDNQVPEYRGAGEGISCYQCCAYNFSSSAEDDSDFEDKLYFRDGKHFSMGAWQVMTLNLPRAAYRAAGDTDALFSELRRLMDRAVEVFKVKLRWMNALLESRRIPFAQQRMRDPVTGKKLPPYVDFDDLVWLVGILGLDELVHHHVGAQMHESRDAYRFAIRVMTVMEHYCRELSEKHGMTISFARTPAESTGQRFAIADLLDETFRPMAEREVKGDLHRALDMLSRQEHDLPVYYTNGPHVPPDADVTLAQRIMLEHTFFPIVDGGDIMHIWLGEAHPDPGALKSLAMKIVKETQTGYFAFTKDFTVCLDCADITPGISDGCEQCGSENVDHYSRVTGYYNAVSGWNEGKQQELKDRMRYSVS